MWHSAFGWSVLVLCLDPISIGALTLGQSRQLASQLDDDEAEPVPQVAWTPPPAYALGTFGHKTMYLADVAIGAAGQTFRLLVDTGSPLVVLPGPACQGRTHRFDTKASKPQNRTLEVKYGLGSVAGHVFKDQLCVQVPGGATPLQELGFLQERSQSGREMRRQRDLGAEQVCAEVAFLATDSESADFAGLAFDGILGLGLESASELRSGLDEAGFSVLSQFARAGVVHSTAFALQLSNSGASQLLLGDVDESRLAGGKLLWVSLSPGEDGFWQFPVQDLMLDGQAQNYGRLQVAVDSGTSLLAAEHDLGAWLKNHLQPSDCAAVDHLPKLELMLPGGAALPILPADYVDQAGGDCKLALMPSPLEPSSSQQLLLGDSFLRRYVTVFDRQNGRLGFGAAVDDSLAKEMLPVMFPPPPATTPPPTTPAGPPPPVHLDYGEEEFVVITTPAPPTAEELVATQQKTALTSAFDDMGDDLEASFDKEVAHERGALKSAQKGPASLLGQSPASLEYARLAGGG